MRTTASLESHPLWSVRYLIEADRAGLKKSLDAIGLWRGRHPKDFGIMLIEMWAYVCDVTSFYDETFAHEWYVRTARRVDSLHNLVSPLGYIPRPAIAALAELAVFADGRQEVALPAGTAFRSSAFAGNPPQIFELDADTNIHPFLNQWTFLPVRRSTFGPAGEYRNDFLCEAGSVSVKEGDLVLVKVGSSQYAVTIIDVAKKEGVDHLTYQAVTLSSFVWLPAGTPVSSVRLLKASAKASLWTRTSPAYGPVASSSLSLATETWFLLDSISPTFKINEDVIVEHKGVFTASSVKSLETSTVTIQDASTSDIKDSGGTIIAKVPIPAITAQTTQITISGQPFGALVTMLSDDSADISIHHSFVSAGKISIEALTEMDRVDPLNVRTPIESPREISSPGEFELEDVNGLGLKRPGSLNFVSGQFAVQGDPWPEKLAAPVKLLGNIVSASRGETINAEFLGVGDSAMPNQNFTLKKSPLTYLPTPSEDTPSGLTSTLKIYVDGVRWTEVPSFYGSLSDDEIYIVRQNSKDESVVTFGDGSRGRVLSTGAVLVAYYRFGGGAAIPPAGSISQIAKPFKGLKGVRSPVAPYGGADSESGGSLRKYAPRSALLLGRAISLPDLEAAAASYSGVRAVAAEWRWSGILQIPAAHIWYLADGDLTELLLNKLKSLAQPDTPVQVERAVATATTLTIQLVTDPKRFEVDVLAEVRSALMNVETGLLPPERVGIGKPLFRSQLFDFLLNISGVLSISGLSLDSLPFSNFGTKPEAGHFFDFTNRLYLNGRNA